MNPPNTAPGAGVDVVAWARALGLTSAAEVSEVLRVQISKGFALVEDLHIVAAATAEVPDQDLPAALRRAAGSLDGVVADLRAVRAAVDPTTAGPTRSGVGT